MTAIGKCDDKAVKQMCLCLCVLAHRLAAASVAAAGDHSTKS